jgi:hypothetical protein
MSACAKAVVFSFHLVNNKQNGHTSTAIRAREKLSTNLKLLLGTIVVECLIT